MYVVNDPSKRNENQKKSIFGHRDYTKKKTGNSFNQVVYVYYDTKELCSTK